MRSYREICRRSGSPGRHRAAPRALCAGAAAATALSLLAGCGLFGKAEEPVAGNPGPPYEEVLARWLNHSESDLINAWGVPTRSQLLSGGGQVLEYQQRDDKRVYCSTLFTTDLTGTIQRYVFRGSDCRASPVAIVGVR